jgi:Domain of unknown function (DUF4189)
MKNLTRGILLVVITLALAIGPALHAAGDSFAAIAFSPSTGRWGYGNGFSTKSEAIARARRECGRRDSKTNWCKDAWITRDFEPERWRMGIIVGGHARDRSQQSDIRMPLAQSGCARRSLRFGLSIDLRKPRTKSC